MIDLEVITTFAFFLIVSILIILDRKNIQFQYGIILRRWKRGVKILDKIVKKGEKFLKNVGDAAIVICLMASFIGIGFLLYSVIRLKPSLGIVLPTAGAFRYPAPIISVPFWYWLVSIFIVLTAHESMHALFIRLAKVPIKNYGIVTFLALPIGAFVDPDTKRLKSSSFEEKLRIYAAGSFSNFIVALFIYLLAFCSIAVINAFIESTGVKIGSTIPGTPAYNASISGILQKIDNFRIKSISDLDAFLKNASVGQEITVYTDKGVYSIKLIGRPENETLPFIGIANLTNVYEYKWIFSGIVPDFVISSIQTWLNLLFWLFLFNTGVGIFNMLPLRPLDGGLICEEILNRKVGKKSKVLMRAIELIVLVLVVFSLFVGFISRTFI
jgi:membrane-associated protease RseP (regulator of RpoE activity)